MIFETTLSQMAFLFSLIVIGYLLGRLELVPEKTEMILSKLENYIFLPALVMGNFMGNFTTDKLFASRTLLLGSIAIEIVVIALSCVIVRLCSKDPYVRKIYLYGLAFANFGFMGNAVVSALFPEIFSEYIIFTLVLWVAIYLWGAPCLLMGSDSSKGSFKESMKNLINPMFIGMVIGMVLGLAKINPPTFLEKVVHSLGDCMSPIAMLLTGITISRSKLKEVLSFPGVYVITGVRLLVFPLLFLAVTPWIPAEYHTLVVCALASLAMPLGLNTIVIPGAYGKGTPRWLPVWRWSLICFPA